MIRTFLVPSFTIQTSVHSAWNLLVGLLLKSMLSPSIESENLGERSLGEDSRHVRGGEVFPFTDFP